MQRTDISVIIPTCNRAAWLPTCLAHLEQQSFPAGRFEVIVVDDGSEDGTVSVLERYASGAPVRIRCRSQKRKGLAAARNLGAETASGDVLLFLRDDELTSPRLLEQHHAARESRRDEACLMGDIRRHPQLPPDTFTRLFLGGPPGWESDEGPRHFLDWHRSNFSIPRQAFLDTGGFSTDKTLNELEIPEWAHRAGQAGITPFFLADARAYVWQPTTLASERARQYQLGYGLWHLLQRTGTRDVPERFRLRQTWVERWVRNLTIPYYVRACIRHEEEANRIVSGLYSRVLHHDRLSGHQDASHHRSPRPPAADGATAPLRIPHSA